jgi:hypothetical protein
MGSRSASCRAIKQPAAADAFQRPLRSRFQARLSRSVRRLSFRDALLLQEEHNAGDRPVDELPGDVVLHVPEKCPRGGLEERPGHQGSHDGIFPRGSARRAGGDHLQGSLAR